MKYSSYDTKEKYNSYNVNNNVPIGKDELLESE
jgi:hypothetical protein